MAWIDPNTRESESQGAADERVAPVVRPTQKVDRETEAMRGIGSATYLQVVPSGSKTRGYHERITELVSQSIESAHQSLIHPEPGIALVGGVEFPRLEVSDLLPEHHLGTGKFNAGPG